MEPVKGRNLSGVTRRSMDVVRPAQLPPVAQPVQTVIPAASTDQPAIPTKPKRHPRRFWRFVLRLLAWLLVIIAVAAAVIELYAHYYQ